MQQLRSEQQLGDQQQQQQQLIHNNKARNKNRILIVDDDSPGNSTSLKLELERNGFKVDIFTDPLLALDHFNAGTYNVVVLDKKCQE